MNELRDIELLMDARTPLILIETVEMARVETVFQRLGTRTGLPAWRWTLASGLQRLDDGEGGGARLPEPQKLLAHLLSLNQPALYLLQDLHRYLNDPLVVSQLRELATQHGRVPNTIAIVAPKLETPAELSHFAARIELALPTREELGTLIADEAAAWGQRHQKRVQASQAAISGLIRNLTGIGFSDAQRLVRRAVNDGLLDESDLPEVMSAKYKLLDQGGVLSFELNAVKLTDVAGLAALKKWLENRREVFLADTAIPGLDAPKGLLLLGVQGGGKSLAAKAVAGGWGLPLIRLDFATLYNKYYGETERNLRDALKTAAVMAPCVLWIDEIEKGLASEGDEGGPGKRILGTLLTWMAEHKEKVFLVATANDIEALPPELLRKGRFDEIFFVDLPKPESREAIFAIHLKKRGQDPATFDMEALAKASEGFSGAEIEQAVVSALYASHARKDSLKSDTVVAELTATKPLSVVMAEKMAYLRAWAAQRTVSAD